MDKKHTVFEIKAERKARREAFAEKVLQVLKK